MVKFVQVSEHLDGATVISPDRTASALKNVSPGSVRALQQPLRDVPRHFVPSRSPILVAGWLFSESVFLTNFDIIG